MDTVNARVSTPGPTGATGATGATGPGYKATSTTSLLIGTGSKAFTTQAGLAYAAGARARASSAANTANYMEGLVTSYSGTTLTVNVTVTGGSGTLADWNINLAGDPGPIGGSGTANTLPKFTASTTLGDSAITDTGTVISAKVGTNRNFRVEAAIVAGTGIAMRAVNDAVSTEVPYEFHGSLFEFLIGQVGLGVSPTHLLHLAADDAAKPTTNTWTIVSDARTKRNVTPFRDGLAVIESLVPIQYQHNGKGGSKDGDVGVGILAQDAQPHIPYCISTKRGRLDKNDATETDIFQFNSHALTFILINAVKELSARVQQLEARGERLK